MKKLIALACLPCLSAVLGMENVPREKKIITLSKEDIEKFSAPMLFKEDFQPPALGQWYDRFYDSRGRKKRKP